MRPLSVAEAAARVGEGAPTSRPRSSIVVSSTTLISSPTAWRSASAAERATLTLIVAAISG